MRDELRRMALFGSGVAELTRNRAEQIVKEFVKAGDVRREQTSSVVRELLDRNRENRREIASFLRTELQGQVANLGLATKRDVERLERRIARLEKASVKGTAKKTTAKTTKKKAAAKPSGADPTA